MHKLTGRRYRIIPYIYVLDAKNDEIRKAIKSRLPLHRHRNSKTLPYVLDPLSVPIQQLKFIKIREKGRKLRSPPQPPMLPSGHRSSSLTTVLPKSLPFHGISHPIVEGRGLRRPEL